MGRDGIVAEGVRGVAYLHLDEAELAVVRDDEIELPSPSPPVRREQRPSAANKTLRN